ncbi:pilus assembly FimT family protein [Trichormus azollae]|uniref:pilus assembly FimT family protein n=1 Tax=Trichormus azollae TaxID=1164 RepID=UPI003D34FD2E
MKERKKKSSFYKSSRGFTLLENLVILLVIGILAAILITSWSTSIKNRRLNPAQGEVYQPMRQVQSQAKKDKLTWQISFPEQNGIV